MNFLQRIAQLFRGGAGGGGDRHFPIYVMSRRCREPLAGQVDMLNELSVVEEDDAAYYTRKVLHTAGQQRCFDQVEVLLWFDGNKQLLRQEVWGGSWLEADAYASAVAEFQARLAAAAEESEGEESSVK
ncbi:MAG: hypothetical protein R3C14_03385 [Caldilineaceae bacterium]